MELSAKWRLNNPCQHASQRPIEAMAFVFLSGGQVRPIPAQLQISLASTPSGDQYPRKVLEL